MRINNNEVGMRIRIQIHGLDYSWKKIIFFDQKLQFTIPFPKIQYFFDQKKRYGSLKDDKISQSAFNVWFLRMREKNIFFFYFRKRQVKKTSAHLHVSPASMSICFLPA
jgi:hypothetical protein